MEDEAWNDITLSSSYSPSNYLHPPKSANAAAHHGFILQDLLSPAPTGAGDLGPAPARSLVLNRPPPFRKGREQLTTPCFLTSSPDSRFDSSSSSLLNSFLMKQISNSEEIHRPVDRRFNRMMKNRESAARSRNRKMAYTFELERKKIHLTEENARLRKELQKQKLVTAAVAATEEEARKKPNLSKSMSALF